MADLGVAPHVIEAMLNHKSGAINGVGANYNRYSYDSEKQIALGLWSEYVLAVGASPD